MDKSILETVHEGVKDLHEANLVGDITLREFDALCLPPVKSTPQHKSKASEPEIKPARLYLLLT